MKIRHIIYLALVAVLLASCSSSDDYATDESIDITDQDDDRTTDTIDSTYTYKLPVIFHVLYTTDNDSVRSLATRLATVLQHVNELYSGNVYGRGGQYSENINVDFQLARTDESGNTLSTPGVEFVRWNGSFPIEASSFMTSGNTQLMWEPNEYINVMVYPFQQNSSEGIILGISHMPYTISGDTQLDGLETTDRHYISKRNLAYPYCVSVNSDFIYRQSTRYDSIDHGARGYIYDTCDFIATLAHELGHYLGLHHVFTESQQGSGGGLSWTSVNDCYDSDFCSDTKSYNKFVYDDSLRNAPKNSTMRQLVKRQSCDGDTYDSDNIMDYAIDYSYRFTPQQKERIRHVLYYSPLIPGPKLNNANTAATRAAGSEDGVIDLPIVTSE